MVVSKYIKKTFMSKYTSMSSTDKNAKTSWDLTGTVLVLSVVIMIMLLVGFEYSSIVRKTLVSITV